MKPHQHGSSVCDILLWSAGTYCCVSDCGSGNTYTLEASYMADPDHTLYMAALCCAAVLQHVAAAVQPMWVGPFMPKTLLRSNCRTPAWQETQPRLVAGWCCPPMQQVRTCRCFTSLHLHGPAKPSAHYRSQPAHGAFTSVDARRYLIASPKACMWPSLFNLAAMACFTAFFLFGVFQCDAAR